jgi:B-box zinc finger
VLYIVNYGRHNIMNNICSVHKKLQAVAYCGECDMMLCVECFSNHPHISMNIKQYNDIHQILMDSSRSVYISALLNLALVTLKQLIEEKLGEFNDNHCTNEKKAISLIQSLKLESHKQYLENIKKRISYKIDSRISEHIVKSVTKIVDTICNTNYGQMPLEGYINDEPQENQHSPPKKANVSNKSQQNGIILDEIFKAKATKEISI